MEVTQSSAQRLEGPTDHAQPFRFHASKKEVDFGENFGGIHRQRMGASNRHVRESLLSLKKAGDCQRECVRERRIADGCVFKLRREMLSLIWSQVMASEYVKKRQASASDMHHRLQHAIGTSGMWPAVTHSNAWKHHSVAAKVLSELRFRCLDYGILWCSSSAFIP